MATGTPGAGQVIDYESEAIKRRRKLEHHFPVMAWLRDVDATPEVKRGGVTLASVLAQKQRHGIVEKIGRERLAECCRVSVPTVQRHLNELYRAGLLGKERRHNSDTGHKVTNGYHLIRTFASDAGKRPPKYQNDT